MRRPPVLAVGPDRKQWWRAFRTEDTATLTLRGARVDRVGVVAEGDERDAALRAYVDCYPRSARLTRDAAVVVFRARGG